MFNRIKGPVFLKENSNIEKELEKLKSLEPLLNKEGKNIIRQDIKYLEYGIIGEKNIEFELKNTHMPMCILHDIYLEHNDLSAQIDYLVFTKKLCFIIECKNLYGDIEVNNSGDFIRAIDFGGVRKKEGIYSPVTQNKRHLELMKHIKLDNKKNLISKFMTERYFEKFNIPVVVLSNPKTVLNIEFAKKEIKDKIVRADNLINYIKTMHDKSNEPECSDDSLLSWANYYLNLHVEKCTDYTLKYDKYKINEIEVDCENQTIIVEELEIFKELKSYRLSKSKEENIKPYFIYNDNQIKALIRSMPKTKEELKAVNGFGEIKINKYGNDIIEIIKKY